MGLVAGLQAAQDRDRVFDVGLSDHHRLKPSLQRRILLDMLPIFAERGRPNAAELAAGQGRLEQIGRVGAPFGGSRTDHRVELVDEQHHVASGCLDLAKDRLQAVLKLTAVFRAGDQRAEVERHHASPPQVLRHVGLHDPQGQPLGDGRLAHARLADQHRVVFRPPREHLDHAANLGIATDHRIELSLAGTLREVDAIFLERLELLFGILVGHPRLAADGLQPCQQFLLADRRELQHVLRLRRHLRQRQQQVVGRDKLVLHLVRFSGGRLEDLDQFLIRLRLGAPRHLGQMREFGLDDPFEVTAVGADLLEQRPHNALALGQKRLDEVDRGDLGVAPVGREFNGRLDRLLGLDGELVESKRHDVSLLRERWPAERFTRARLGLPKCDAFSRYGCRLPLGQAGWVKQPPAERESPLSRSPAIP